MISTFSQHGGFSGVRYASVFTNFMDNIGRNLSENQEVTTWMNGLKNDPLVKLTAGVVEEAAFYGKTALNAGTAITKVAVWPITYPLSFIIKKNPYTLVPCPFPAAQVSFEVESKGDLVLRKQNLIEKFIYKLKNVKNAASVSKNAFIRVPFQALANASSVVVSKLTQPSKEQLVQMSIQMYYPTFTISEFKQWIEKSFLPVLLERYLRGNIKQLEELTSQQVAKERQLAVVQFLSNRLIIRTKLLSITDVDIMGFDFTNRMPSILVRCSADHTNEVITMNSGTIVEGGPQDICHTDFLVVLTIDASKDTPRWIASELRPDSTSNRI